jgi:hypothetical protein
MASHVETAKVIKNWAFKMRLVRIPLEPQLLELFELEAATSPKDVRGAFRRRIKTETAKPAETSKK